MTGISLVVIPLLLLKIGLSETCIFSAKERSSIELKYLAPWTEDEVSISRQIESDCECGKAENESYPWHLYIHVLKDLKDPSKDSLCPATIITSNLVATSHECVLLPGKQLNAYNSWNVTNDKQKNFADKKDIIVTSAHPDNTERFWVEEVILNQRYIVNRISDKFPDDNFLLLKLNADFTSHPHLRPICLPTADSKKVDFVGHIGLYYGVVEGVDGRTVDPSNGTDEGIIFTKQMCDDGVHDFSKEYDPMSPLCLRWSNQFGHPIPNTVGGPLILKSSEINPRAFLAGLACDVSEKLTGTGTEFAYFTNMLPLMKYVEYQSEVHKSKWCKISKLSLGQKATPAVGKWPWEHENLQAVIKLRNESLNCVCGVSNSDQVDVGNRIAGGAEASPYEFGWMTLLRMHHQVGGTTKTNYCGGSIINDRMILTAAHCVIHQSKLSDSTIKPRGYAIEAHLIDVTVNVHQRVEDPNGIKKTVATVLVHPNYVPAKKNNYFDYDIALLILKDTDFLEFPPLPEKGIRPICLPKIGEPTLATLDAFVLVSGWGLLNPDDRKSKPDALQKIELPIISLEKCRGATNNKVTDRFLCAGSLNKFKDAASGDSGGPMSIKRNRGRGNQSIEVGLVSWGDDSSVEGKTAALYTDITHPAILPFIDYYATRTHAKWCKSEIGQ